MNKQPRRVVSFAATAVVAVGMLMWVGAVPPDVTQSKPHGYLVPEGVVSIEFDRWALEALGWQLDARGLKEAGGADDQQITFTIQPSSTLRVESTRDAPGESVVGTIRTHGGLLLTGAGDRVVIGNLAIGVDAGGLWTVANTLGEPDDHHVVFELSTVMTGFSARDLDLRVIGEVSIAEAWAYQLGFPEAAGIVIGSMTIEAELAPVGGTMDVKRVAPTGEAVCVDEASQVKGEAAGDIGSDVIVAMLQSVMRYGRVGDITAYAVGTWACNVGDARAGWIAHTNDHPLILQNMYRLKEGRFEQIGMSWCKHGFYAVSGSLCSPCYDPTDGSELGVGCSDPYSAQLNGVQGNMSMRSDVNAHTAYFPYPPTWGEWEELIDKRLQVHDADLDPDLNQGAFYFVQGHYVNASDVAAGNSNNNASYRRVVVFEPEETPNVFEVNPTGVTQRQQPAIRAWKDTDSSVVETDAQVPGEGLFIVAMKMTDLGTGFWHYEYAIQNLNSDRCAGSFTVPLPRGAVLQNIGFHDVDYHSGEIYDLTDWEATVVEGSITWTTESYDVNPNANALRFSTLYSFRFDANVGPGPALAIIGLFKPGLPEEVQVRTMGPTPGPIDCQPNGIEDCCDIECGAPGGECDVPGCGGSDDCSGNLVPDECEPDCNENGIADECDIANCPPEELWCADCNENTVPDVCEPDCDHDGIPDECDTFDDTDEDGVHDCWDLCPYTTPPGACVCPEYDRCCWPNGICIDGYPHHACIPDGGIPDCIETPCREGCLIGDYDGDGDRDLEDVASLQRCFGGSFGEPGYVTPSTECLRHHDFDPEDDDV
ncbi:MAG: hypothetical protein WBE26_07250, partial [Phycisphaerae bacterium]